VEIRSTVGAIEEKMDAWIANIRDDQEKKSPSKKRRRHVYNVRSQPQQT
jgi:hypothetical protein